MLTPDVEARRTLVTEHQADLAHDALRADGPKPDVMESRIERRRLGLYFPRFRLQPRPARDGS